jgi:hypothetical protein
MGYYLIQPKQEEPVRCNHNKALNIEHIDAKEDGGLLAYLNLSLNKNPHQCLKSGQLGGTEDPCPYYKAFPNGLGLCEQNRNA